MNRHTIIRTIVPTSYTPQEEQATAYAPVNIALVKYWGKRNEELFLPVTDSVSISLSLGTTTTIRAAQSHDIIELNGQSAPQAFQERLSAFLDYFRPTHDSYYAISTHNDIATAAGLASSASGFAAVVKALNQWYGWQLSTMELSILARMGSGSSCRSMDYGFVQWKRGERPDGMDSFGQPWPYQWPELRIGFCMVDDAAKPMSSTNAMRQTKETSPLYAAWPSIVATAMQHIEIAIRQHDFRAFGRIVEQNALSMHATMFAAAPAICYWHPKTVSILASVWQARQSGIEVYATMDAGPNVKLIFLEPQQDILLNIFPDMHIIPMQWPYNTSTGSLLP